jgi:4-hydroxybenzoate polyprenyltransferase
MFLNDAFDAEFDLQHRKERPIPAGNITLAKVWGWGFGWLAAGCLILSLLGSGAFTITLWLVAAILVYDAVHKAITLSPILMALCRFLLYLLAARAASRSVPGLVIWSGLVLALYVLGLSYLARGERSRNRAIAWPCVLLFLPLVLAWYVNAGVYRGASLAISALVAVWVLHCLRETYWSATPNIGRTVSGLLAGICLVDLLAVVGSPALLSITFVVCFFVALACQRYVPAT